MMERMNAPPEHRRRAAAQQYARHGWSVFPIAPGKKQPPLIAWKALETERPTLDRVTRLFRRWPAANIGIVTGAVSGITVVDVDVKPGKRGNDTLAALVAQHGKLPHTPRQRTWSGGMHRLLLRADSASDAQVRRHRKHHRCRRARSAAARAQPSALVGLVEGSALRPARAAQFLVAPAPTLRHSTRSAGKPSATAGWGG